MHTMKKNEQAGNYPLSRQIRDYEDEVSTLRQLLKTLHFAVNIEDVLRAAVNIMMQIISYESCVPMLWNKKSHIFLPHEKWHVDPTLAQLVHQQLEDGLFDWVIRENRPVFLPHADEVEGPSSIIVPFVRGKLWVGALSILTYEECTQRHRELLSILGDEVAETISNLQLVSETVRVKNNLKNIISNMADGVMTIDPAGSIGMISEGTEKILGIGQAGVQGKLYTETFMPPFSLVIGRLHKRLMRTKVNAHIETDYQRHANTVPLRIYASVLYDEMRNAVGVVYVIMDISKTRELNELRRLDELKTSFLNNVSHELKTPLTSMKWAVDLLEEKIKKASSDKDTLKLLTIINSENERLIQLVTDLLDYSRIEAGKIVLELETVDLPSMVEDSIDKMALIATKQQVEIKIRLDGVVPAVMLDLEKIRQVINNLLSNAIKFSEQGGLITVIISPLAAEADESAASVMLQVEDQGIGIPDHELSNIFDKFHRVADQRVHNIQGTGLGLSICKSIIALHEGRIWAEKNIQGGTTLTVLLPICQKEE